ncbi:MAG TPA: hypothetical protein VGI39_32995 [Polyangiaceae bacterium]|jgi:hypothetical protein
MRVGCNYPWPWNAYGTYFGNGDLASWTAGLDDNLGRLRDLGVEVVRIFLMGNAWSYGRLDGQVFTPGESDPALRAQLEAMLAAFQKRDVAAIPSLIDFKGFQGPAGTKGYGGRAAMIADAAARAGFFDSVFEPLLQASESYRGAVYAWEVMNEPAWCMLNPFAEGTSAVRAFLEEGLARVAAHNFSSTVGHRFARDLERLPTGSIRQFHYYPRTGLKAWLPLTEQPLAAHVDTQAILGEFATRLDSSQGDLWPELPTAAQRDPARAVVERLRVVEGKGYGLALLWPDLDGAPVGPADPLKLSAEVAGGLREYTGGAAKGGVG